VRVVKTCVPVKENHINYINGLYGYKPRSFVAVAHLPHKFVGQVSLNCMNPNSAGGNCKVSLNATHSGLQTQDNHWALAHIASTD
jgi:hypothetical protein